MNALFSQRQFDCLLLSACGYDRAAIAGILGLTYGQTAYACGEARRKLIRLCRADPTYNMLYSAPLASLLQEALRLPELQGKLAGEPPERVFGLLYQEYLTIKRGER